MRMALMVGPFAYELVLGSVPPLGISFFVTLCAGWCVNAVSAPFFLSFVAKRRVAALWLSSAVMAEVNVAPVALLGRWFGDQGVVAALSTAVAVGSTVTIVAARRSEVDVRRWVHGPELLLIAVSIAAAAAFVGPTLRPGGASVAVLPLILAMLAYASVVVATLHHSRAFHR